MQNSPKWISTLVQSRPFFIYTLATTSGWRVPIEKPSSLGTCTVRVQNEYCPVQCTYVLVQYAASPSDTSARNLPDLYHICTPTIMSSAPYRSSSADHTSEASSLVSPTEDAQPIASCDPSRSASADYTSVASSLASPTESAQPSAVYDPSRSADDT
jgi:hypothetical protein